MDENAKTEQKKKEVPWFLSGAQENKEDEIFKQNFQKMIAESSKEEI